MVYTVESRIQPGRCHWKWRIRICSTLGRWAHHVKGVHLVHSRPVCVTVILDDAIGKLRRESRVSCMWVTIWGVWIWIQGDKVAAWRENLAVDIIWGCEWHNADRNTSALFPGILRAQLLNSAVPGNILNHLKHLHSSLTWRELKYM